MTDDTQAAAPPTDHTDVECNYSWCKAHGACTCPYSSASPHRRANCKYATGGAHVGTTDDQEDDQELPQ